MSDVRLLLRSVIENAKAGILVVGEATRGAEAVEHAQTDDPMVIVLDHRRGV